MMQCKFFYFVDAPFRKVNLFAAAGMHIRICDAEGILCKFQLALIGSTDNQDHSYLLNQRIDSHGVQFTDAQCVAGNIAVHAVKGSVSTH